MSNRSKILAAGAVVLVAGLLAGLYFAWQDGLIPANIVKPHPRAPVPENFLATLKASPVVAQSLKPACVRIGLYTSRDIDRMGRPGLNYQRMPGWDVITIAQVPGEGGQRIGNLTQALEALAKAGIYTARDSEVDDGSGGKLPARSFSLTFAGWNTMVDEQCMKAGTPEVTEITEFSRVMPDKDGKRIYDVKAKYAPQKIAPWVDDPAILPLVQQDQIKKLREPTTAAFRLVRTDEGWDVEKPESDGPELTQQMAMGLIAKWREGTMPQACIRLPGRGGTPGFDVALTPYAATLYETPGDTADARFMTQLLWQSRLAQLVKAGVFRSEQVAADPKLNAPAGTRYVLDAEYQKWLDMNDARCLRMGEGTLEFVSLTPVQQQRRETSEPAYAIAGAKLMLKLGKDAWIEKTALALPEVEAVKEAGGVPVLARFMWTSRDKEWRLSSLQAPQSEPVPQRMPRTNFPTPAVPSTVAITPAPAPGPAVSGTAPGGDVTWAAGGERGGVSGRVSNGGLTVTYCCAGASSATLSSQSVSSGKVYAEFAFTARPRALQGDTYTTIGIFPAPTSTRVGGSSYTNIPPGTSTMAFQRGNEINHNDLIGLAIDVDAGKMYVSRNGVWMNGQPGAGGGIQLSRGQAYNIAAVLSASSSSSGTDSWTANFGKTKFRYAVPRGYKSYDGRQRG